MAIRKNVDYVAFRNRLGQLWKIMEIQDKVGYNRLVVCNTQGEITTTQHNLVLYTKTPSISK